MSPRRHHPGARVRPCAGARTEARAGHVEGRHPARQSLGARRQGHAHRRQPHGHQVLMSRIAASFEELRRARRKALIPYITAGDPSPQMTVPLLHAIVEAGADIVELGVPFSDPMADGPVVQRAGERALKHGVGLCDVLDLVVSFRKENQTTPVVLMGYANPVEAMGVEKFVASAKGAGVDGVIVVDYPPEECQEFAALARKNGIDAIFLLAPT